MKTTRFPWFAGISLVKFFDESTGGDIRKGLPGVLRTWKTLPLDEILETTTVAMRVQDILDFVIFLIVFDVQRRRCGGKTRSEGRGSDEIEEGDVKNVVELAHRGRKGELVSL
jgi:hypothetical protein